MWQDGPAYVQVFVGILRDIFKEETVEYVLALIDEMLAGNWKIFWLSDCTPIGKTKTKRNLFLSFCPS